MADQFVFVVVATRVHIEAVACQMNGCPNGRELKEGVRVTYRPVALITLRGERVTIPVDARAHLKSYRRDFEACAVCVRDSVFRMTSG